MTEAKLLEYQAMLDSLKSQLTSTSDINVIEAINTKINALNNIIAGSMSISMEQANINANTAITDERVLTEKQQRENNAKNDKLYVINNIIHTINSNSELFSEQEKETIKNTCKAKIDELVQSL